MSQPCLPFLAMLNLPDLAKLMNDLVSHDPRCPPSPPSFLWTSQILKARMERTLVITSLPFAFGAHQILLRTILLDCDCFNALSLELRCSGILSYLEGHMGHLISWWWSFLTTFSYPSIMMLASKFCLLYARTLPLISRIISRSGIERGSWLRLLYPQPFS